MTRLFFDYLVKDTRITINSDESHYISSVLRMHPGEGLTIVDSSGEEILAKIDFFDNKSVTLSVCSRRKCTSEPTNQVTLYQSISKGERMVLTIQKSVELGVARIVPVLSNRCVVKIDSKSASSKVDRWQKIALEAARQSGRGIVPEIAMPMSMDDAILQSKKDNSMSLILWEDEHKMSIKQGLEEHRDKCARIGVFVGPEGGYEEQEVNEAIENGAVCVTVGPRILRTETAGPAALSMIMYALEM